MQMPISAVPDFSELRYKNIILSLRLCPMSLRYTRRSKRCMTIQNLLHRCCSCDIIFPVTHAVFLLVHLGVSLSQ